MHHAAGQLIQPIAIAFFDGHAPRRFADVVDVPCIAQHKKPARRSLSGAQALDNWNTANYTITQRSGSLSLHRTDFAELVHFDEFVNTRLQNIGFRYILFIVLVRILVS